MEDQRRQERNREDRIVKELLKLVAENEYTGEIIYRDLAKRAKRKKDRRRLNHLVDEKRDHLKEIKRLYRLFFYRELPQFKRRRPPKKGFKEILSRSLLRETDNNRFYRQIYDRLPKGEVAYGISVLLDDGRRALRTIERMLNKE